MSWTGLTVPEVVRGLRTSKGRESRPQERKGEIGPQHGQETRHEAQRGGAPKRSKGQKVKTPKAQMQGNERTECQNPKGPNARK